MLLVSAPRRVDGRSDPQNVPSALFGLGYMYLAGYGVVLDHRKAFKYFSQAAEQAWLSALILAVHGLPLFGVKTRSRSLESEPLPVLATIGSACVTIVVILCSAHGRTTLMMFILDVVLPPDM